MHIAEGFLPLTHALAWHAAAWPVVGRGVRQLRGRLAAEPTLRLLLGAAGGFCFLLSALKLPSLAGSSSHPTGAGLAAVLFGPSVTAVVGTVVLVFQALLLAHGGLSTLGANVVSMAIAGPGAAWAAFRLLRSTGVSRPLAGGVAAGLGALTTYVVTALQLAAAYPDPVGGVGGSALKFLGIFAVTQAPLAVVEGMLTAGVLRLLLRDDSFAEEARLLGAHLAP